MTHEPSHITCGRVVISSHVSGAGKTLVTSVLTALLNDRGYRVQPFKYSADFVDAHVISCGGPVDAKNLSYWTLGDRRILQSFVRNARDADVAVVEGGAGLVDGPSATSLRGTTAHVACILMAPVILVFDPSITPYSAVMLIRGARQTAPDLDIRGFIFSKAPPDNDIYLRRFRRVLRMHAGLPMLGHLPNNPSWAIPGTFYPMLPPTHDAHIRSIVKEATLSAVRRFNLAAIVRIMKSAAPIADTEAPISHRKSVARIAIPTGMAFHHFFLENIDLLKRHGAEIVTFDPLSDGRMPEEIDGLYLTGRFPETFAPEIEANVHLRRRIRDAADKGIPICAEGGGLKYAARSLEIEATGNRYEMCGIVPLRTVTTRRLGGYGLVWLDARQNSFVLQRSAKAKGYVLPHCRIVFGSTEPAIHVRNPITRVETDDGFASGNIFATNAHINWLTCPSIARNFVRRCIEYRKMRMKNG